VISRLRRDLSRDISRETRARDFRELARSESVSLFVENLFLLAGHRAERTVRVNGTLKIRDA